ncbi:FecR family protein [Prevotella sp. 10(H)]|uniref:FecR family protein n=1 Tax=Prevotella sp. 10(H) TaxID=1158294 RepID=UPI0004A6FF65|nr:FecR domain-containing protein [Prevotella sp. 10(H)]
MILKEKNDKLTNEAWDALYKRFEDDGLLPAQEEKPKRVVFRPAVLRWTAVAAVVSICLASALVIKQLNTPKIETLTLQNNENTSTLVTTLEDGSVVYLSQQASLVYPVHFEETKREVAMQGDAFFEISKNKEKPFIIDTETATIEVLGTAFNIVSKDSESFSLSVKNGEVKVTLKKDGQSVNVRAGESVLLQSDNLTKKVSANTSQFESYLKQIHFKDEKLADVIRIINMNSGSTELALSPELKDRLLTMTLSNDSPETIAQLICLALNLTSTRNGDVITISASE